MAPEELSDHEKLYHEIQCRYQEALKQIEWLESELMRYKLLLENKDVINNSLPTPKNY